MNMYRRFALRHQAVCQATHLSRGRSNRKPRWHAYNINNGYKSLPASRERPSCTLRGRRHPDPGAGFSLADHEA